MKMPSQNINSLFQSYSKSNDFSSLDNFCINESNHNKHKDDLQNFISSATKELDIEKLTFSTIFITAFGFKYEKTDKHFDFLLEAINQFIKEIKNNNYKVENVVAFFIAQYFDIMLYQIPSDYHFVFNNAKKHLPQIVYELSKVKYEIGIGDFIEIALIKSITALEFEIITIEESKIILKKIIDEHFDNNITEIAQDTLHEINKNYG